jgi:AP-1 complex subunit beta-1
MQDVMGVTSSILQKLLAALNECTEWGQVFILDSLSKYGRSDFRATHLTVVIQVLPD